MKRIILISFILIILAFKLIGQGNPFNIDKYKRKVKNNYQKNILLKDIKPKKYIELTVLNTPDSNFVLRFDFDQIYRAIRRETNEYFRYAASIWNTDCKSCEENKTLYRNLYSLSQKYDIVNVDTFNFYNWGIMKRKVLENKFLIYDKKNNRYIKHIYMKYYIKESMYNTIVDRVYYIKKSKNKLFDINEVFIRMTPVRIN